MEASKAKYLKDYCPPTHQIKALDLYFNLFSDKTIVKSVLAVEKNAIHNSNENILKLDGNGLKLLSLLLDGQVIGDKEYKVEADSLTIFDPPEQFLLEVTTQIHPEKNTLLTGLYKSGNLFCTQCEAEGFRRITYYPDRPDVMTSFTCTIEADKKASPVLLSNGNLIEKGDLENGRHFVKWHDPFKKPSYLFALVAGDLYCHEDRFTTVSGKSVALQIFVEHENKDKTAHAMDSLIAAMQWDEEKFGREYDLDIYMIVAVNDFNMGAMENKGLNVFNSKYVLAKPETATDMDFQNIEAVIGHEYFHNWTGNRITLANWFQLSLKEGLTVYRDQEFTGDRTSKVVKRISDVKSLRIYQFPEDAGPMSHPVRPESYIKMDNFYTHTVYNKGAEVIRMIATIVGESGFRKGMDLYFERHDGQAVTVEHFVKAMEDACLVDLSQFRRWYAQSGTPVVQVKCDYNAREKQYFLTCEQIFENQAGDKETKPFHIPISVGLMTKSGDAVPCDVKGSSDPAADGCVLHLKEKIQTFVFNNVETEPIPSLFRNFSAPVKLRSPMKQADKIFLMAHDTDLFVRWDASQQILFQKMFEMIQSYKKQSHQKNIQLGLPPEIIDAFKKSLTDDTLDKLFLSKLLDIPSQKELAEFMWDNQKNVDPDAIHHVHQFALKTIALELKDIFLEIYHCNHETGPYKTDAKAIAKRGIKNAALSYLGKIDQADIIRMISDQFKNATNMTDEINALNILSHLNVPQRIDALALFYEKWQKDTLVLDKWFTIQAQSNLPDTLSNVKNLMNHPAFSIKNPNKVRSLINAFCSGNEVNFHDTSGEGYKFLADQVIRLDMLNPQIAARLVSGLNLWKRYDTTRQRLMKEQLDRIQQTNGLSSDVAEIVGRSLS